MNIKRILVLVLGMVFILSVNVQANMNQIKAYKEAYPDAKPKCTYCHVDSIPKKDDGKHQLNAYGTKVKAACEKPTAETYKSVGKADSK